MTIVNVKVETKSSRIDRERKAWVEDAVQYFLSIGAFDRNVPREVYDCIGVAESIYESCMEKDGSIDPAYDPISSAKEELTYWGE